MQLDLAFVEDMWAVADPEGYVLPHTVRRSRDSAIQAVYACDPPFLGGRRGISELRHSGYRLVPVTITLRDPTRSEPI